MPGRLRSANKGKGITPLDYYQALEAEDANLVLADDAITGLKEALSGKLVSDEELDEALGVTPPGEHHSRRLDQQ